MGPDGEVVKYIKESWSNPEFYLKNIEESSYDDIKKSLGFQTWKAKKDLSDLLSDLIVDVKKELADSILLIIGLFVFFCLTIIAIYLISRGLS